MKIGTKSGDVDENMRAGSIENSRQYREQIPNIYRGRDTQGDR
jgi:hypothetical protein